jgi:hypothetical protein
MAYTKTKVAEAHHKTYIVRLTKEEREQLAQLANSQGSKERRHRAQILLHADVGESGAEGWTDELIAASVGCHDRTVQRIRKQFVLEGLEATVARKPQSKPSKMRKLDGRAEAQVIALACGKPPEGRVRWTYRLLADKVVELEIVPSISHKTVWETLKKTNCSLT